MAIGVFQILEDLQKEVQKKPELRGIDPSVVRQEIESFIKKSRIVLVGLSEKDKRIVVKEVRANLRDISGIYQVKNKGFEKAKREKNWEKIADSHISVHERKLSYAFVKKEIEDLQPSSILDLGCGLNPIILASKGMEYYALDINKEMLDLVKNYFSEQQISGGVLLRDLRQIDNLNLPRTDMCLILKVFDVLEKKGHKLAENILDSIKSKLIVVSFSTKTLSGKKMNHPQRGWIERLFKRKGFSFKTFKVDNEIFYFAAKERD